MDGLAGLGAEVGAATAAGLIVLVVERWLGRDRKGAGAEGARAASRDIGTIRQHGNGSTALVQQGKGHRAVFDHSTHTTTHNTYRGGGGKSPGDDEDAVVVFVAAFIAVAVLVAGFFFAQHYLRIAFLVLTGLVVGSGVSVVFSGAKSGKTMTWQVFAALPWLIASSWAVWLWGRWTCLWGEPLPRLAELQRAVEGVQVDESQGRLSQVFDYIGGIVGLLARDPQWLMPGVYSILAIVILTVGLIVTLAFLPNTRASARLPRVEEPSENLRKRAEHFDRAPWRAGGAAALGIVLICVFGWGIVSAPFLPWAAG